jgi:hypothetical protein
MRHIVSVNTMTLASWTINGQDSLLPSRCNDFACFRTIGIIKLQNGIIRFPVKFVIATTSLLIKVYAITTVPPITLTPTNLVSEKSPSAIVNHFL